MGCYGSWWNKKRTKDHASVISLACQNSYLFSLWWTLTDLKISIHAKLFLTFIFLFHNKRTYRCLLLVDTQREAFSYFYHQFRSVKTAVPRESPLGKLTVMQVPCDSHARVPLLRLAHSWPPWGSSRTGWGRGQGESCNWREKELGFFSCCKHGD